MMHKAIKAIRKAAAVTLIVGAPMMAPGMAPSRAFDAAPGASGAEIAQPVANRLVPARTRLIIEYRRVALA